MERTRLTISDDSHCVVLLPADTGSVRISEFRAGSPEEAARLLDLCQNWCHEHAELIGPIGADTWSDYRLVVESDGRPAFPGEPSHPAWYPRAWEAAGFAPFAWYCSAIDDAPRGKDEGPTLDGVEVVRWSDGGTRQVLEAVHAISERAFARAPFFSPIEQEAFVSRFLALLAGPAGQCSAFATHEGEVVGYVLGYPDGSGGHVLKTLVSIRPGVGMLLTRAFYGMALRAGTNHVIHGLMHEDNLSLSMSRKLGGRVFRRYALFRKEISG